MLCYKLFLFLVSQLFNTIFLEWEKAILHPVLFCQKSTEIIGCYTLLLNDSLVESYIN